MRNFCSLFVSKNLDLFFSSLLSTVFLNQGQSYFFKASDMKTLNFFWNSLYLICAGYPAWVPEGHEEPSQETQRVSSQKSAPRLLEKILVSRFLYYHLRDSKLLPWNFTLKVEEISASIHVSCQCMCVQNRVSAMWQHLWNPVNIGNIHLGNPVNMCC